MHVGKQKKEKRETKRIVNPIHRRLIDNLHAAARRLNEPAHIAGGLAERLTKRLQAQ